MAEFTARDAQFLSFLARLPKDRRLAYRPNLDSYSPFAQKVALVLMEDHPGPAAPEVEETAKGLLSAAQAAFRKSERRAGTVLKN